MIGIVGICVVVATANFVSRASRVSRLHRRTIHHSIRLPHVDYADSLVGRSRLGRAHPGNNRPGLVDGRSHRHNGPAAGPTF